MRFGKNFLPTIPARWSLTNASMTESKMTFSDNGSAKVTLTEEDTSQVYREMQLIIVSSTYTKGYTPDITVEIEIGDEDQHRYYTAVCPIVDIERGIYKTILITDDMKYTTFVVTIKSDIACEITSWELAGPADAETDISGAVNELKKELPALLYDYNTARFDVQRREVTIALISARLLKNTDLNGHLQLTYTASQDCTLVVRLKDNDVTELFAPILYDIKAGRGSIGIPHAYVQKVAGIHTFTATAQVTTGELFFDVRSVLYTIDGGQLALRIMDVGMDIKDIALRRLEGEREPSWVYAIGIDDDKLMIRARPHSDNVNVAWEPTYIGNEALDASIVFDGTWANDEGAWRLITNEEPWILWIDLENNLWAQYYDLGDTKILLAENVNSIGSIMGWHNPEYPAQDQGLIAVYSKADGKVYYRNYCFVTLETKNWDYERQVTEFTGTAENVHAFRTNDYRVGISIQDTTGTTTTLFTHRNWVGMASPEEHLRTSIRELDFSVITIEDYIVHPPSVIPPIPQPPISSVISPDRLRTIEDEGVVASITALGFNVCPPIISPQPAITAVRRSEFTDNKTLQLEFNYPLVCDLPRLKQSINIVTTSGVPILIDYLTQDDNKLTIKVVEELKMMDNLILTYAMVDSYYLAMYINDNCNVDYGQAINLSILGSPPEVQENLSVFIDATFTVTELRTLERTQQEYLTADIANLTFTVTEIDTHEREVSEHLEAGIGNIGFTVTQIGTDPL